MKFPAFLIAGLMALASQPIWAQTETGSGEKRTEDGFETLFDGSSMDSFRGYHQEKIGKGWTIDDGVLYFDGSGGGDIVTKEEFQNFELRFDWKIAEGANSGVMYRVTLGDNAPYFSGPEYQLLDDGHDANPMTSSAALYAMYAPEGKKLKPVGSWNSAKIVLAGDRVEHWLNGKKVVEAEFGSDDWYEKLDASKFKTWSKFGVATKGRLAFQDHGGKVWFRNIRIKTLDK